MAATITLWFVQQVKDTKSMNLLRFRPWYRQKRHFSQVDIAEAYREVLYAAGITPAVRFLPDMPEINQNHRRQFKKIIVGFDSSMNVLSLFQGTKVRGTRLEKADGLCLSSPLAPHNVEARLRARSQ